LRDITNASTPISITATGTASTSHNFSPVSSQIQLRLRSLAAQTPAADGTIYAEFTSITVYAEWEGATPTVAEGTLNLTQLGYDTIDKLSGEISADAWGIGANSQSIIPFVSDPALFISDVLINAAGYGDASQNRWAVLLREGAIASDDLPLLVAEQYPALTGYDWIVNYEGPGLSDIGLSYSLADVFNWIRVEYTDSLGVTTAITPDTDSSLTDATSVTQWGQREYTLRINHGGQTAAVAAGKRFLASHKDPKWLLASGLQLSGRVKDDIGVSWPVNRVRAGQRIKVGNFFDDGSGTYLNFLITSTDYDAESESMTVEVGVPAIMLASAVLKFESTVLGIQ
jgi:hypothetical protein